MTHKEIHGRRWWEPHDERIHAASRGAAVEHASELTDREPLPAVKPAMSDEVIPLRSDVDVPDFPFFEVLQQRCSVREYGDGPIPLDTLALLLGLAAQNTAGPSGVRGRPGEFVARTYPSGGACHSLEVYPVVAPDAVGGVVAGVYHYCPHHHRLERLSTDPAHWRHFLGRAKCAAGSRRRPPLLLLITSRFGRVRVEYQRIAYSLVLKEVGCLIQNLYLCATLLDLAPCALAAIDDTARLAELGRFDPWEEPLVGELIVGPKRLG